MRRQTASLVVLFAVLPCVCFWEVFDGDLLLPTDWVYRDLEPWRRTATVSTVVNSRIKDAVLDGYALDVVSARAAREGAVMLWNPYAGGGVPHLAGGFSRMLYPPFWLYGVLDPQVARNAEILLHLFLAQFFAFLFLQRVGASRGGSIFGAIVFGFTPSLLHRAEIPFILPSLVWFPLLLFCIEGLVASGRLRYLVGLAFTVALQLLAGHFPDTYLHFLGASGYGLVRLLQLQRDHLARRLVLCLAGVGFGVALAAPFLIPAAELIVSANRPTTPLDELATTGLPVGGAFLTLFSPWVTRSQLFIGLTALVFVPSALATNRRSAAVALLSPWIIGVAIGTGSPFVSLLYHWVPGYENLKYIHTHIALASYSLALLAGLGLSRVLRRETRYARWLALVLLATLLLVWILGSSSERAQFRLPGAIFVIAVLAAALMLFDRERISRWSLTAAVSVLVSMELFSYARMYNPRVDPDTLPPFPEFASISFLKSDPDLFRVASLLGNYQTPFWPNSLGAYGVEDVAAYHSLLPAQVGRFVERMNLYAVGASARAMTLGPDAAGNWLSIRRFRPDILSRLWNIKYFLLPAGAENPDPEWLELVYDDEVRLFRYRTWLPRAWLADRAIVLPGERGAYAKLRAPGFDPTRTVILEQEPACSFRATSSEGVAWDTEPVAEVVELAPERLVLRTRSPRFNYLVLSETYYPGWEAEVDGTVVPVLKANLNFRAIPLGPGAHEVTLFYRPASYRWGWIAAWTGLGLLGFSVVLSRGRVEPPLWILGMAMLPLTLGVAGFRIAERQRSHETCGQLRVDERVSASSETVAVRLRNGTLEASTSPPPELALALPAGRPKVIDFRFAHAETDGPASLVLEGGDGNEITRTSLRDDVPRWRFQRVFVPSTSEELTLRTMGAPILASPLVMSPRERLRSEVLFLSPDINESELESYSGVDDAALRILMVRRAETLPGGFDVVFEGGTEERFSERLVNALPDLYRFHTVLVAQPELPGGDGTFTSRQRELVVRALARLGLEDDVGVSLR